jgi:hypothetical protein
MLRVVRALHSSEPIPLPDFFVRQILRSVTSAYTDGYCFTRCSSLYASSLKPSQFAVEVELRASNQLMQRDVGIDEIRQARQNASIDFSRVCNDRLRCEVESGEVEHGARHMIGGSDEYQRTVMFVVQDARDILGVFVGSEAGVLEKQIGGRDAQRYRLRLPRAVADCRRLR